MTHAWIVMSYKGGGMVCEGFVDLMPSGMMGKEKNFYLDLQIWSGFILCLAAQIVPHLTLILPPLSSKTRATTTTLSLAENPLSSLSFPLSYTLPLSLAHFLSHDFHLKS